MILYYSATGNCKDVATRLAALLGEKRVYSMMDCIRQDQRSFALESGEKVGIITPTYFCGVPKIPSDFIRQMDLQLYENQIPYIYHIATYGTSTGAANGMMADLLAERGLALSGRFGIRMVDTWTPVFNLTDQEKMRRITDGAQPQIQTIAGLIEENFTGNRNNNRLPRPVATMMYNQRYHYGEGGATAPFAVEDACIGCGLCEKKCPSSAIKMENGRPVWVHDTCNLCLGCLHRCPKFAIQYGSKTKKHGQFQNPYAKV